MRILLLVDCYFPHSKSSATQMHDMALEFRRRDHDVVVLTPSERISENVEVAWEDGVQVIRVKTRKIKGALKVFRALEEARLSSVVWRRAKQFLLGNPVDLIVFYSPTIFWGDLVKRLKSLWGCPSYLILRDIFPAWAVDAGLLRKGLIYWFFRRREINQYDAADRIAVQSPANLEYFTTEFPDRCFPLEVLYNCAVRLSGQNHIRFLLVGEGSEVPRLKTLLAEKRLDNIQILPTVNPREYLAMLSEFDVGLLSLDRRLKTHNLPGKLLGYMYWGRPTLASINPGNDLFEILHNYQAGFCFLNGDDDSFCAAALKLANSPELRARMGSNSRKLLEQLFSVDAAVGQITKQLPRQAAVVEQAVAIEPAGSLPLTGGL